MLRYKPTTEPKAIDIGPIISAIGYTLSFSGSWFCGNNESPSPAHIKLVPSMYSTTCSSTVSNKEHFVGSNRICLVTAWDIEDCLKENSNAPLCYRVEVVSYSIWDMSTLI